MDNRTIARRLFDEADLLAAEPGNLFRCRAYRRAAETVLGLEESIADLVEHEGPAALEQFSGIGPRISEAIQNLVAK